jgi:hypothetical protein
MPLLFPLVIVINLVWCVCLLAVTRNGYSAFRLGLPTLAIFLPYRWTWMLQHKLSTKPSLLLGTICCVYSSSLWFGGRDLNFAGLLPAVTVFCFPSEQEYQFVPGNMQLAVINLQEARPKAPPIHNISPGGFGSGVLQVRVYARCDLSTGSLFLFHYWNGAKTIPQRYMWNSGGFFKIGGVTGLRIWIWDTWSVVLLWHKLRVSHVTINTPLYRYCPTYFILACWKPIRDK